MPTAREQDAVAAQLGARVAEVGYLERRQLGGDHGGHQRRLVRTSNQRRRRSSAKTAPARPATIAATAAHGVSPTLTGPTGRPEKRPTADSSSSSLASDLRKPCVTSTWRRDWVNM